jgi:hypothetical protein
MVVWEQAIAPCMEHITWGWHPMYHNMTIMPLFQKIMLLVLWTHNKHEANAMVATICNIEKTNPLQPMPFTMMLLKTFLFA